MPFSDPIVAGDGTLIRDALQSTNWDPVAKTGWRVEKDGTATFNSVVLRGEFRSDNFSLDPATGFQLKQDGTARFSDLEVTGDGDFKAVGFLTDYLEALKATRTKSFRLDQTTDTVNASTDLIDLAPFSGNYIEPSLSKRPGWTGALEGYKFTMNADIQNLAAQAAYNSAILIVSLVLDELDAAGAVVSSRTSTRQCNVRSLGATRAPVSFFWTFNLKRESRYKMRLLARHTIDATGSPHRFYAPHTGFTVEHAVIQHLTESF